MSSAYKALLDSIFSVNGLGTRANILGLQIMAIDSFVALRWPLKHHIYMNKSAVRRVVLVAWFITALLAAYYPATIYNEISKVGSIIASDMSQNYHGGFCRSWYIYQTVGENKMNRLLDFDNTLLDAINKYEFAGLLVLALIMLIVIYGYRSTIVRRTARKWSNSQRHNRHLSESNRQSRVRKMQMKGFKITVILSAAFIGLWSPCIVMSFVKIFNGYTRIEEEVSRFGQICRTICCLTTIIDVLVYMVMVRSQEVKRLYQKVKKLIYNERSA